MIKCFSSEYTSQSSYSVKFGWETKDQPAFFTEVFAGYLNFRKTLNDHGGFLSQNKTETDMGWRNDVGLRE